MECWEPSLDEIAENALPGGVAVAALGAAMGAALVAKALRLTIERGAQTEAASAALRELRALASSQGRELLSLSRADAQAYQAVLDTKAQASGQPEWRRARQEAIELPVRIAEACRTLSLQASGLAEQCSSPVRADLQSGILLLEVGVRSALLAVRANVRAWGEDTVPDSLKSRIVALEALEGD